MELNAQEHTHSLVVMMHNENTKVPNNNQFIYYRKRKGGAAAQKHDMSWLPLWKTEGLLEKRWKTLKRLKEAQLPSIQPL